MHLSDIPVSYLSHNPISSMYYQLPQSEHELYPLSTQLRQKFLLEVHWTFSHQIKNSFDLISYIRVFQELAFLQCLLLHTFEKEMYINTTPAF